MELSASAPIKLSRGESVLLLLPEKDDAIAASAEEIFRRDYGVDTITMRYLQGNTSPGPEGYDLLTDEGSGRAAERISGIASLAGMVITLPHGGSGRVRSMEDVSRIMRGLFLLLKPFLESPEKKFVVSCS